MLFCPGELLLPVHGFMTSRFFVSMTITSNNSAIRPWNIPYMRQEKTHIWLAALHIPLPCARCLPFASSTPTPVLDLPWKDAPQTGISHLRRDLESFTRYNKNRGKYYKQLQKEVETILYGFMENMLPAFVIIASQPKWKELPVIFLTVRGDSSDIVSS